MPSISRTLVPGGALGTTITKIIVGMLLLLLPLSPCGLYSGSLNSMQVPTSSQRREPIICKSSLEGASDMVRGKH